MTSGMPLFVHIFTILIVAEGLRTRRQDAASFQSDQDAAFSKFYRFDEFVRNFGRTYVLGSGEYLRRAAIFQDSLSQIYAKNSRADRSWTAGVHPFMDWTDAERAERLHGYEPRTSHRLMERRQLTAVQTDTGIALAERLYGGAGDSFEADATPVRDQGGLCGSCWAFSAVAAVEAQLRKSDSPWQWENGAPQLSVQALLDCVPNPGHCGGKGGCFGATPELAFDFMQVTGVPTEQNLPYHPLHTGTCPIKPYPPVWKRVVLAGWRALPSNQAQPLMQALVQDGPVVVAVDAHKDWYHYQSGIYDGCPRDAIVNHGLLAKGYGVSGGKKYWRLQNSWGTQWGEQGNIRLVRHDDEDSWCGTDSGPEEGFLCEGESRRNVTVCGSCGLLFDMTIPKVASVTVGQDAAPTSSGSPPASFTPGATSGIDLLGTYSAIGVSSAVAAANSDTQTFSQSSLEMPRLSEQSLTDSHNERFGISDTTAVFKFPKIEAVAAQDASAVSPYGSLAESMASTPSATDDPHVGSQQSSRVQGFVADHFTVDPAVDAMTDLVDVVPTEDQTPQAQALSAHDTSSILLPTEVSMADAIHADMNWPFSGAKAGEHNLLKDMEVSEGSRPHSTSSASFADHMSSVATPSLSRVRSAVKMPFRSLKATDSMDAYERLVD